jgi:hypothetical protein
MPLLMQYIAHPAPTLPLSSLDRSVYNTIDWSASDDIHYRCTLVASLDFSMWIGGCNWLI